MKITHKRIKAIIKEETLKVLEEGGLKGHPEFSWVERLDDHMEELAGFYRALPEEGKRIMTKNFQLMAAQWEEEMAREGGEALPSYKGPALQVDAEEEIELAESRKDRDALEDLWHTIKRRVKDMDADMERAAEAEYHRVDSKIESFVDDAKAFINNWFPGKE